MNRLSKKRKHQSWLRLCVALSYVSHFHVLHWRLLRGHQHLSSYSHSIINPYYYCAFGRAVMISKESWDVTEEKLAIQTEDKPQASNGKKSVAELQKHTRIIEYRDTRMKEIRFYRANEKPYGAFSNLYRREIEFEGVLYPTTEHAYQAGKARKDSVRDWLMSAPSPALLAMAAHGLYSWDIQSNWSKIKYERMKQVLRAKFTQHEDLRELLLSTGEARLVEAATVDNLVNRTWGEVNGKGKNMLGVLLMEVRSEIREALIAKGGKKATTRRRAVGSKTRGTEAIGAVR